MVVPNDVMLAGAGVWELSVQNKEAIKSLKTSRNVSCFRPLHWLRLQKAELNISVSSWDSLDEVESHDRWIISRRRGICVWMYAGVSYYTHIILTHFAKHVHLTTCQLE